jgi:hypothetical protein
MPLFPKTVSGLNKSQLLSAAATFDFDATGTTDALRLRLRAYVEANKAAIMANPDHCPLFSKKDRDAWATAHRSVTLSDGGTTGTTEAHGHPSLGSLVDTLLPDKTSSPSVQRARLAEIQSEIQRHKSCIEVLELWNSSCASEQTTNDSVLSVMIYLQVVSSKDGEMWFSMRGDKKFKSLMATYAERMGKNVHNLR